MRGKLIDVYIRRVDRMKKFGSKRERERRRPSKTWWETLLHDLGYNGLTKNMIINLSTSTAPHPYKVKELVAQHS